MKDAIFLANVWKRIREFGWQSVVDFGDIDGIDFVANRVLESSPTLYAADVMPQCEKCGSSFLWNPKDDSTICCNLECGNRR